MTARGKEAAALALHRFGFGPATGSIAAIATDPQGALMADLARPQAGLVAASLPSSTQAHARFQISRPSSKPNANSRRGPSKPKPTTP